MIPMMLLMAQGNVWLAALAVLVAALPMPIMQWAGYPTYAERFLPECARSALTCQQPLIRLTATASVWVGRRAFASAPGFNTKVSAQPEINSS